MMKLVLTLTLLLIAISLPAIGGEARVSFREPVYRGPDALIARELLHVWSDDASLADAIRSVSLNLDGSTSWVRRDDVISDLRQAAADAEIQWVGASAIRRGEILTEITENQLLDAANDGLRRIAAGLGVQIETRLVSRPRSIAVLPGKLHVLAQLPLETPLRSRMPIPVEIRRNNTRVETVSVWMEVRAMDSLAVFRRQMERGDVPSTDDLEIRLVDIATLDERPLSVSEIGEGLRLRRDVRAGEPLLYGMLEPAPAVDRGERVRVRVTGERIAITAWGTAEDEGFMGDVISVQIDNADGVTLARVVAEGVTHVEL